MFKVGTSGIVRSLVSIYDYVRFYEIGLTNHPRRLIAFGALWMVCLALSWWYGESTWLGPQWLSFVVFAAPLASFAFKLALANAPSRSRFETNEIARNRALSALPDDREVALGFERIRRSSGFDGPIIVSDRFNIEKMSDPEVDWPVTLAANDPRYDAFLKTLRRDRQIYVDYGRRALMQAVFKKALINEKKVAFTTAFPPDDDTKPVGLMRTDYFAGLCTAERSLANAVSSENGAVVMKSHADDRTVFRDGARGAVLPKLADNPRPVSLQFGIEVMAVSSDGLLRVPVQSVKTQYSQNMRAPLASGSIDWDDVEGAKTLKGVLRQSARRELSEEWGAKAKKSGVAAALLKVDPEPMGYFRNPLRCGKPQFVTFARLPILDADLEPDETEVMFHGHGPKRNAAAPRSVFPVETVEDLIAAMDEILSKTAEKVDSLPLLGAAHILRSIAVERPDRIKAILDQPI